MFRVFSDRARLAVVAATEEARRLGHGTVGTEHLLLGLLSDAGVVVAVLDELRVTAVVRDRIEQTTESRPGGQRRRMVWSAPAKDALELALREAKQAGQREAGTAHVLLGILQEGEGLGGRVLRDLGVELSKVRDLLRPAETAELAAEDEDDAS